jgi:tetratricopeptide (TPR) repeat protein
MNRAPFTRSRLFIAFALGAMLVTSAIAQRQPSSTASASLVVKAAPGAIIWVDSIRYGTVPASGELTIKNLRAGTRTVRARIKGKREATQTAALTAGAQGSVRIAFSAPATKAELQFQEAEELRERGKHAEAITAYRQAIKLKGGPYPAARAGLARSLMATEEHEEAVAEARRAARESARPYPEAHTIIANTLRAQGLYEEAMASYRTALTQARDFSPEAHTGVAITYQELNQPNEAAKHFRLAAEQSNDTEPIIYFLLGNLLEREQRAKEAVAVYEKYLQLDPQGRNAPAVRSVLKQLQREIRRD